MKKSLKSKLIFVFVLVIVLPLLLLGTLSYIKSESVLRDSYIDSSTQIVSEVADRVENYLHSYEVAVELFAQNPTVQKADKMPKRGAARDQLLKTFQSYVDSDASVLYTYMGTPDKSMIDPSWLDVPKDYDPTSREWYIKAFETGHTIWTEPYVDAQSQITVVSVASPVYNFNGDFVGVVSVDLSLDKLSQDINEISIGKEGYPVIIDQNGLTMTHKNPEIIGLPIPVPEIVEAIDKSDEGYVEYNYEGDNKFATFATIPLTGWTVLVTMDIAEINSLTFPILMNTVVIGVVSLIFGLIVALVVSKSITKPISNLENTMNIVKDGDLTVRSKINEKNEIGRMSDSFNIMIDNFSEMLSKSTEVSEHVVTSSEALAQNADHVNMSSIEIASTIDEIARGASEQVKETDEGVNVINRLAEKIGELSDSSKAMSEVALGVKEANEKGSEVMIDLKTKNDYNNESTKRIADAISALESKTSEINGILETITNIASQTNLLALNASIEAARAGEHGKGFAVVAEEIRKLAEGSSDATESIRGLVVQISEESNNAVTIMSEVSANTNEQSQAVSSVESVFSNISASIGQISELIMSSSKFVSSMDSEKDEIIKNIESISAVSEESAASSEEVTATVQEQTNAINDVTLSSKELNDKAKELQHEISKFKI